MIVIVYQHEHQHYVEVRVYGRDATELCAQSVRVPWADLKRPLKPDAYKRLLGPLDSPLARIELARTQRVGRWKRPGVADTKHSPYPRKHDDIARVLDEPAD